LPVEEKRDLRAADVSPKPRWRLAPEGHGCRVDEALPLINTSVSRRVAASPPHSKFESIGSGYIAVAYLVSHANFFKKNSRCGATRIGKIELYVIDVDVLKGQLTN